MRFVNFMLHPALQGLISNAGMMYADFEEYGISTTYEFPWSPHIRLNFTVHGLPLHIRKENEALLTPLPDCSLIGPQLCRNMICFDPKSVVICICFHPGGFHRLTGIPVHEMINKDLDAGSLMGRGVLQVAKELQTATGPEQMKQIIETFFLKKIQLKETVLQPFDKAIAQWTDYSGNIPVSDIARDACLSIRQFERKCHERLGITPKLFARLVRFSKAYALAEQQQKRSWTSLAYECGYYDQMHLISDFKAFTGMTPSSMDTAHSLKLIYLLETDPGIHLYHEPIDLYSMGEQFYRV
ncbi:helix-turn-helix domain-containing protein [Chitinophaga varians]|uniref:helix-turn-helix domain-containing protein n=1 Tax=Chitinophaga varians TaxID=2202339 RepID=UPI00165F3C96|nr:helix-turn-helix domain-containing protein [Chitinophaga varians]MBC9915629.1 AraC family transcriptional regulator [Chitinophaga varians]